MVSSLFLKLSLYVEDELDKKDRYAITEISRLSSAAELKNTGSRFVAMLLCSDIEGTSIFVPPSTIVINSELVVDALTRILVTF